MLIRPILMAATLILTPAVAMAQSPPSAAMAGAYSTGSSTIGDILADPAAKAVVEKYIPGMLSNDQIEMAKDMTLKQIQQYSPDTVTDANLAKIDADFAKLPAKK